MQKTILLLAISFVLLSCGNQTQKKEDSQNTNQESSSTDDQSKFGRSNFAVIWTTPNAQLISEHDESISTEFTELWKEDIIENAYFDKESVAEKVDHFPNIAFFLKAHSKQEAKSILDDLTIVKEGIASYKIYPVGMQWLYRNTDVVNKKGAAKSFVSVWTNTDQKPADQTIQAQSDKILECWNAGTIENVYFDVEGVQQENSTTDFVLFVNANTQEEAETICNEFPFFKEKIATYKLVQVGVFWFGKYGQE